MDDLLGNPIAGASWEGYVVEQIAAGKHEDIQLFYYRTHDGAECDVVMIKGIKPVACIEIKLSNAPVISRGFMHCITDLKPKQKFIITPQSETYGIQENIIVTGITQFLKEQLPDIK